MMKRQSIELKTIEAMANMDSDTTDSMKKQIFDTAYRFIGGPTMRKMLNMVEGKEPNTLNTPAISVLKALENMDLSKLDNTEKKGLIGRTVNVIKSKGFKEKIKSNEQDLDDVINNAVNSGMIELAGEEGTEQVREE